MALITDAHSAPCGAVRYWATDGSIVIEWVDANGNSYPLVKFSDATNLWKMTGKLYSASSFCPGATAGSYCVDAERTFPLVLIGGRGCENSSSACPSGNFLAQLNSVCDSARILLPAGSTVTPASPPCTGGTVNYSQAQVRANATVSSGPSPRPTSCLTAAWSSPTTTTSSTAAPATLPATFLSCLDTYSFNNQTSPRMWKISSFVYSQVSGSTKYLTVSFNYQVFSCTKAAGNNAQPDCTTATYSGTNAYPTGVTPEFSVKLTFPQIVVKPNSYEDW